MRFKGRMELEHGLKQIDIAPLIDIVFQLLIFFMQPGIKVNLPKAVTSEVVKNDTIEIMVSSESVIYLNGKVANMAELNKLFKQVAKRNQTILIKSDKRAPLGRVVEIWDLARDTGIAQINIATNQE